MFGMIISFSNGFVANSSPGLTLILGSVLPRPWSDAALRGNRSTTHTKWTPSEFQLEARCFPEVTE